MLIKVLGIIPVVDQRGQEMNLSDTVTILNDMCVFAPATLYFNEKGQLVNFISKDRYRVYENIRCSTPIAEYKKFGDLNL